MARYGVSGKNKGFTAKITDMAVTLHPTKDHLVNVKVKWESTDDSAMEHDEQYQYNLTPSMKRSRQEETPGNRLFIEFDKLGFELVIDDPEDTGDFVLAEDVDRLIGSEFEVAWFGLGNRRNDDGTREAFWKDVLLPTKLVEEVRGAGNAPVVLAGRAAKAAAPVKNVGDITSVPLEILCRVGWLTNGQVKGKAILAINGDGEIGAAVAEYPALDAAIKTRGIFDTLKEMEIIEVSPEGRYTYVGGLDIAA